MLVDAHGGRLHALGRRFCGSHHEAEDLVQETFLQAYRSWHQFQGRSSVMAWLYAIAARLCQRFHRKRSGEPERMESVDLMPMTESEMAVVPREADDPLMDGILREGRQRIETAIASLPLMFRMPLVLKEIVGLSVDEIAGILGLKSTTVRTRLHRARMRLRATLETALPRQEVPRPALSKQLCLDLLHAKQEALDRNVPFEFPGHIVCERCAEFFATLDLTRDICRDIAGGELPEGLRQQILEHLKSGE